MKRLRVGTRFVLPLLGLAALLQFARLTSPPVPRAVTPAENEQRQLCLLREPDRGNSRFPNGDAPVRSSDLVRSGWQWVRRARVTVDPGFYVNVEACADEALRISPDDAAALELRALVRMNNHQFREAKVEVEKILSHGGPSAVAFATLSDALL